MAADLLEDGIRVNCVAPGTVGTPWVDRLLSAARQPVHYRTLLEQRQPMCRLGLAAEVAAAISFLASPRASFLTGVALPVDGGMSGLRVADTPGAGTSTLAQGPAATGARRDGHLTQLTRSRSKTSGFRSMPKPGRSGRANSPPRTAGSGSKSWLRITPAG
jgi:hypothetical protein